MKKLILFIIIAASSLHSFSQSADQGIIAGNVLDENKKAIEGVTVVLINLTDTTKRRTTVSDKSGEFLFEKIALGYYRLRLSNVGMQNLTLDSIHLR